MIMIGPISSIFDFLTFYALLHFLHAGEPEFHAARSVFAESLATQTLVLLVIRTADITVPSRLAPRCSRPLLSLWLQESGCLTPCSQPDLDSLRCQVSISPSLD